MIKTEVFYGEDEREVITNFYNFLKKFNNPILSGFQIVGFDLPHMLSRFIKYKLNPMHIFGGRYDCLDTRLMLNFGDSSAKGKLTEFLSYFGLQGKYKGYDGSKVQGLYDSENWEDLIKYAHDDALIEHKLLLEVLKFDKKKYDINNIITFDIETTCPREADIPCYEEAIVLHEENIRADKRIKAEATIQKKIKEFNYEEFLATEKKKIITDKLRNKVVAISVAWCEDKEEVDF